MKTRIKTPFLILITLLVILVLWFTVMLLVMYPYDSDYYKDAGWDCTPEKFADEYIPHYQAKIDELIQTHGIECQIRIQCLHNNTVATVCLYNEYFTVYTSLSHRDYYGDYEILLYYYGTNGKAQDDPAMLPYVQFISDFTHYVAYDTRAEECDNHFLRLYEECVSSDSGGYASYSYHFDELVGRVEYRVNANMEDGTNYMGAFDTSAEKRPCVFFAFEGLLKPLPTADE